MVLSEYFRETGEPECGLVLSIKFSLSGEGEGNRGRKEKNLRSLCLFHSLCVSEVIVSVIQSAHVTAMMPLGSAAANIGTVV